MRSRKQQDESLARRLHLVANWLSQWGAGCDQSKDRTPWTTHATVCREAARVLAARVESPSKAVWRPSLVWRAEQGGVYVATVASGARFEVTEFGVEWVAVEYGPRGRRIAAETFAEGWKAREWCQVRDRRVSARRQ